MRPTLFLHALLGVTQGFPVPINKMRANPAFEGRSSFHTPAEPHEDAIRLEFQQYLGQTNDTAANTPHHDASGPHLSVNTTEFDFESTASHSERDDAVSMEKRFLGKKPQTFHTTKMDKNEPLVEACRAHNDGGRHDVWIDLINATPYTWRKGHTHSYQMKGETCWDDQWPDTVPPGSTVSVRAFIKNRSWHSKDTAGEVAYHLDGTEQPMLFWVEWRNDRKVWVRFEGALETMNNNPTSKVNLGYYGHPESVHFVLAGMEGDFISTGSPTGWMRRTMDDIGDLALMDIAMPRSHHPGMYKNTESFMAMPAVTLTQTKPLYFQISNGGARVLDIRMVRHRGKFFESHGTIMNPGNWLGTIGASLNDMIDQLNEFMRLMPGELFVWDIHETDFFKLNGPGRHKAGEEDYEAYYEALRRIDNRVEVWYDEDITRWPVKEFIGGGQSAVIIRVPESWYWNVKKYGTIPSSKEGFISTKHFPTTSAWTNTDDIHRLLEHQVEQLSGSKSKGHMIHDLQFLHTVQGVGNVFPNDRLVKHAARLWHHLHTYMWGFFRPGVYPGWITVDNIRDESVKVLAMAINKCFAKGKCGDLVSERKTFVYDYVWEGLEYEIA